MSSAASGPALLSRFTSPSTGIRPQVWQLAAILLSVCVALIRFACRGRSLRSARRLVPWWCSLLAKSVCSIVRTMSTRQMQICLIKRTFFDIKKSRREKRRDTGRPPARESMVENDWIDRLGVRVGTGVKWNPATLMAVGTQRGVFRLSASRSSHAYATGGWGAVSNGKNLERR